MISLEFCLFNFYSFSVVSNYYYGHNKDVHEAEWCHLKSFVYFSVPWNTVIVFRIAQKGLAMVSCLCKITLLQMLHCS